MILAEQESNSRINHALIIQIWTRFFSKLSLFFRKKSALKVPLGTNAHKYLGIPPFSLAMLYSTVGVIQPVALVCSIALDSTRVDAYS